MGLLPFGDDRFMALFVITLVITILIYYTILTFYILSLTKALNQVAPHNRRIQTGELWLMLIPIFSSIWHFFVVARLGESLGNEYRQRGIPTEEDRPGYKIGLWMCILSAAGYAQYAFPMMMRPLFFLAAIAGLVFFILYWVKIAGFKKQLEEQQFQFGMGNPNQFPPQYSPQNPSQYPPQNPTQHPPHFPGPPTT